MDEDRCVSVSAAGWISLAAVGIMLLSLLVALGSANSHRFERLEDRIRDLERERRNQ